MNGFCREEWNISYSDLSKFGEAEGSENHEREKGQPKPQELASLRVNQATLQHRVHLYGAEVTEWRNVDSAIFWAGLASMT